MDTFKCLTGLQGTYKWSSTYDSDEHLILSNWKWTSVVKTVSNRIGRQRAVFCLSISLSFAFSLPAAAKGQIILFSSSSPHLPYKQSSDKYERTLPFSQHNYIFPAPPLPCSHPLWTTGESTCTPHSPPTTPIVSHFCPLTIWQLCFTKLTSSAVYNCLPLIWLPFTYLQ